MTILEGESLLNDATALVVLATAIGATAHGFSALAATGSFLYSVVIAMLIGAVVGIGNFWVRRRVESPVVNTILSFTLPFLASVPAELLGSSGLVAAVVAGLITGVRGPRELPAEHRLTSGITWRSIQMLLEGIVFLTMGLQLHAIVGELTGEGAAEGPALLGGLGIAALALVLVLLARTAWVAPMLRVMSHRAQRHAVLQPSITAMQERLEQSQQLTQQHLDAWERVGAALAGIESPTRQQVGSAWRRVLEEQADGGDELAARRLELMDRTPQEPFGTALTAPAEQRGPRRGRQRGDRGPRGRHPRLRRHRRELARRRALRALGLGGRDAGAAFALDARAMPDPARLERYATRLRRASADIGYLVRQPLGARDGAVLVWSGMRGAITVAAAQTLPEETPHRALVIFIAFAVATLSLLLQGGTIGLLVKRLYSPEPTQEEADRAREEHSAIIALMEAAGAEAELSLDEDASAKEHQLTTLTAQRETLLDARDDGLFDADALQHALDAVDAEEIALAMRGGPTG